MEYRFNQELEERNHFVFLLCFMLCAAGALTGTAVFSKSFSDVDIDLAVVAALASFGYIVYDKFIKLKAMSYDPDVDGNDIFEESVDNLETMIVSDDDTLEF